MTTDLGVAPIVGDIWREVDPRFSRFVKVTAVTKSDAKVYAVQFDDSDGWIVARNPKTRRPAPERWAQLKRFNGKRGGYELHQRGMETTP